LTKTRLIQEIYVKKSTVLNTLVTMTLTSDVENSKKASLRYDILTRKFPVSYITMSADHDNCNDEIGN